MGAVRCVCHTSPGPTSQVELVAFPAALDKELGQKPSLDDQPTCSRGQIAAISASGALAAADYPCCEFLCVERELSMLS